MDNEIFALDIGTRKVMGIVCRRTEEGIEIIDSETLEHPSRPMLDGQIQNIEDAAKTVRRIKSALESRGNKKLQKVGVAVAGRDLLTSTSKAVREFELSEEITPEMVKNLELEAVDKIISCSENISRCYCAGYSPVYYELDGERISSLTGHRGKTISCEVIVTLLPKVVLDSMFAVLKKSGLVPTNITLEPISAINAIVPEELRKLNIVLVDIGAGTSDLAITGGGFVFAYGMVPLAGDEITEVLSESLLVDFAGAERIKRALPNEEKIKYEDIWGKKQEAESRVLIEKISGITKKLAESIAQAALRLNGGKTPQAVIVVGGGSRTFNLIPELAKGFNLEAQKIGIRLPSAIKTIKNITPGLSGPEAVTPLGIAVMTAEGSGLNFIEIEVNNKKIKMLDFQQKKDIVGALTLSGILAHKRLYPRPGMAITCTVNGGLKIIRGTLGEGAKILLNGKNIDSLSQKIQEADKIEFQEAIDGENASCSIKDLLGIGCQEIVFNRETLTLEPIVMMNEKEVGLDAEILDRSDIRVLTLKAKDVLRHKGLKPENLNQRQILVNINDNPKVLTQSNFTLKVNEKSANLETEIKPQDIIEFTPGTAIFHRIKDIVETTETSEKMRVRVGDQDIIIDIEPQQIFMNGHQVKPEEFLIDGADIKVYRLKARKVMLSEIFRYIDFNPHEAFGKKMKILVNDLPAGFTTALTEGSRVKIIFEDREEIT